MWGITCWLIKRNIPIWAIWAVFFFHIAYAQITRRLPKAASRRGYSKIGVPQIIQVRPFEYHGDLVYTVYTPF